MRRGFPLTKFRAFFPFDKIESILSPRALVILWVTHLVLLSRVQMTKPAQGWVRPGNKHPRCVHSAKCMELAQTYALGMPAKTKKNKNVARYIYEGCYDDFLE